MLVSQPNILPHERIGRYEVLRKIATGGMAELFLAKQVGMEGFEKVVAIKRILAHLAFDEEFINMFRDEARIVAKLSHPNIVQIYDLGKSDDTYFIAMEYIPGRNLSSVAKKAKLKGLPLPPEYIARCMAQACEGLYYAHTRQDIDGRPLKIVHRDVSPQNIILAFSGAVKLVDFGIAKAATKIAHTRAGVLKGKYAYMSPEQIRGEEIDARSDLFAAGIVLYELLCGRRPFEKENSIQTLKAIVQEPHLDCRLLNPNIPDPLAGIIDRALSKSNLERWQSAQELQLALEDFVSNSGTRCNNIAISRWVSDLFSEELSRDRGGTMLFKGVGEVILPEDERAETPGERAQGSDSASGDGDVPLAVSDAEVAGGEQDPSVALSRGRGGGSIGPRPPIPAPSTALGELSGGYASGTLNPYGSREGSREGPREAAALSRAASPSPEASQEAAPIESDSSSSSSSGSNREAMMEEGIIDRAGGRRPMPRAFHDDFTARASDEPVPVRMAPKDPEIEAALGESADLEGPVLDRRLRAPSSFDDSKTEFMPEAPSPAAAPAPEPRRALDDAETRAHGPAPAPARADSVESVEAEMAPEDVSLEVEPLGPEDDAIDLDDGARNLWDEATVGYPDGKAPIEFIGESGSLGSMSAPNVGDNATRSGLDDDATRSELDGEEAVAAGPTSGPVPALDTLAGGSTSELETVPPPDLLIADEDFLQGSTWAMSRDDFEPEAESLGDEALWDDKTASNDGESDQELLLSPSVHDVARGEIETGEPDLAGERTIHADALTEDVIESVSRRMHDPRGDATLSSAVFEEIKRAQSTATASGSTADPTIGPHSPPWRQFRAGDDRDTDLGAIRNDATLASASLPDAEEEELIDFDPIEESTSRAFEESELPASARAFEESVLPSAASSVTPLNLDSRTVAGVKQDFVRSGLPVPNGGAYDEEEGVEVDFQDVGSTESEIGPPNRPGVKPKRGARGLGAIKLSRVPVAGEDSDVRQRPSFDSSEEMTESGSAIEIESRVPRLMPAKDVDRKLSVMFDEALASATVPEEVGESEEATVGIPSVHQPATSVDEKEVKLDFDLFDEFSIESRGERDAPSVTEVPRKHAVAPPAPPPADRPIERAAAPSLRPSSIAPRGSAPPLTAPSAPGGFSIGSTNVPPASLSLSEMLAIPVGGSRSSFQVISRANPQGPPGASGARARGASVPGRQIREVVRPASPQNGALDDAPGALDPGLDGPPGVPSPGPAALLDLPLHVGQAQAPARRSQRVLLTLVIVLTLCVLAGAGYLLLPQFLPRDPQLTIRTTPEGANIYLNGQLQPATTPATLGGLQPGVTYELRLVHRGYEVAQNQVPIPKNTRNVVVQIQLKPAAVAQPAAPAVEPISE